MRERIENDGKKKRSVLLVIINCSLLTMLRVANSFTTQLLDLSAIYNKIIE